MSLLRWNNNGLFDLSFKRFYGLLVCHQEQHDPYAQHFRLHILWLVRISVHRPGTVYIFHYEGLDVTAKTLH